MQNDITPPSSLPPWLAYTLAVIIPLILASATFYSYRCDQKFITQAVTGSAIVTGKYEHHGAKGTNSYDVTLSYPITTANGVQEYTAKLNMDSLAWSRLEAGRPVEVAYLPDAPGHVVLESEREATAKKGCSTLTLGMLAVTILITVLFWRPRRSNQGIIPHPPAGSDARR